jgi:hypothetical protein
MIMEGIATYGKAELRRTLQATTKMTFVEEEHMEGFHKLWCPHFTLCARYSQKLVLKHLLLKSIWKVLIDFGALSSPFVRDIPVS